MIQLNHIATEQRNAATAQIDTLSTLSMLQLINEEDKKIPWAIAPILPQIARAVDCIAARLKKGGRLFYLGAGTSGRLGVLDAAECPPTYGTDPPVPYLLGWQASKSAINARPIIYRRPFR